MANQGNADGQHSAVSLWCMLDGACLAVHGEKAHSADLSADAQVECRQSAGVSTILNMTCDSNLNLLLCTSVHVTRQRLQVAELGIGLAQS